ncbi:MAG: GspE family protein [Aquabacterium sp.]|jgi:Tfp pilus assembly pilus retraction ATPase PilT|nr:GspE family protein [Aquabacterium sp.]
MANRWRPSSAQRLNARERALLTQADGEPWACTDIHLCATDLARSLVFPGPRLAVQHGFDVEQLVDMTMRCEATRRDDFMVEIDDRFFRGRRDNHAVDGLWIRLRRIPEPPPTLDTLPTPLPGAIKEMLLAPQLANGGIVYITGAPASGKTTTAAGVVVSRLTALGGMCYTLEDPPEYPLNGWHGKGYCSQTWVQGDTAEGWAEAFRGALRSQPSGVTLMMYVGEVRDAASALALIRAAGSGFLVVATGFATDIPSGIDALLQLAHSRADVAESFASLVRLVVHQRIVNGRLRANFLASPTGHSPVAAKIRAGLLTHLGSDLDAQANEALARRHPFARRDTVGEAP